MRELGIVIVIYFLFVCCEVKSVFRRGRLRVIIILIIDEFVVFLIFEFYS